MVSQDFLNTLWLRGGGGGGHDQISLNPDTFPIKQSRTYSVLQQSVMHKVPLLLADIFPCLVYFVQNGVYCKVEVRVMLDRSFSLLASLSWSCLRQFTVVLSCSWLGQCLDQSHPYTLWISLVSNYSISL